SSRSGVKPVTYCGVTAVSSITTPAALAPALPAAAATSSIEAAATLAIVATSSSKAARPEGIAYTCGSGSMEDRSCAATGAAYALALAAKPDMANAHTAYLRHRIRHHRTVAKLVIGFKTQQRTTGFPGHHGQFRDGFVLRCEVFQKIPLIAAPV